MGDAPRALVRGASLLSRPFLVREPRKRRCESRRAPVAVALLIGRGRPAED